MASDPLDNAADYQAALNDQGVRDQLATHTFEKPSLAICMDCDAEIPQKRQQLGGVKRCTECENYFQQERRQRGFRQ